MPFPIPLVRDASGWRFDTEQGAEEVLRRRVGADELDAIDVCRAYATTRQPPPCAWRGYNFRAAQGKDALVAYPVAYGSSGIMTFVAARDGRVYEKDLGDKTRKIAEAIRATARRHMEPRHRLTVPGGRDRRMSMLPRRRRTPCGPACRLCS